MADPDESGSEYEDEGSYSQSSSQQEGEYYSDGEEYDHEDEGSYDSRDTSHTDGSDLYDDDIEDRSHSYSDRSPSGSQSYLDEDEASGSYSEKSPRSQSYDDDDQSGSGSYYSDRTPSDGSYSQSQSYSDRTPSHSYDEDDGSYSDRSPSNSQSYDDQASGSYSDRSRSRSQSYDDEPSGSYSDRSQSESYADEPSASYSDRTPSQSYSLDDNVSGSYDSPRGDENNENRNNRRREAPTSPGKAYGYNDGGTDLFSDEGSKQTNSSMGSTPSFAFDSQHSGSRQNSSAASSGHRKIQTGKHSKENSENTESEDYVSSASSASGVDSFATEDFDGTVPSSKPVAASGALESAAKISQDGSLGDFKSSEFKADGQDGGDNYGLDNQNNGFGDVEGEGAGFGFAADSFGFDNRAGGAFDGDDGADGQGLNRDQLFQDEAEEGDFSQGAGSVNSQQSSINSQSKSVSSRQRSEPVEASYSDEEDEDSGEEDDSFFGRSLISREPDQLPRITEHSERSDARSNRDSQSVTSFQSENTRSIASPTASVQRSVGSRSTGSRSLADSPRKVSLLGGYSREQMTRLVEREMNEGDESHNGRKGSRRRRKIKAKSEALIELVANVNEAMTELEDTVRSDYAETKETDLDSSSKKLLLGFEALVGILLQISDELDVMSTFVRRKDAAAIESLETLLSFAPILDDMFVQLKPILMDSLEEEEDDEMTDFLYGMNLLLELLCELTHDVGEKQEWNPRANTSYSTLLELLSRDTLEVTCIFDDVDTPDYEPTETIEDAWAGTGHEEEYKSLQEAKDLDMFRQVCYDVLLSTDQWCPDTKTLMDVCGIDESLLENHHPFATEDDLVEVPEAAVQVLEKINGEPLARLSILSWILRRVLPTDALTDKELLENITQIKSANRNSLGLPSSNLIAISSVPEVLNDPEALGVAGVGKTTLAAMVARHSDVRRFFNDGVAWIHVGRQEITYTRYVQYLREIVMQLDVAEDEEPLFPELLHTPGESKAKRRRREEGFMLYIRDIMVDFLQFRNVLIIVDNVCSDGDLDWFDFDPAELLPDDAEEENTCVILVTTRLRSLLPAADTVEVDMLEEGEAVELLIKESGELAKSLAKNAPETRSVVLECANHPLAVKSVGRWLNLKHATAGGVSDKKGLQNDVMKSMEKILKRGNQEDADMMYEILNMSLSPAINGEPTNIIKFCFAAFVLVFCSEKHLSEFAVADSTPVVPLAIAETLFESLLDLEEEKLLQDGSLFYAQKKEAAVLIPEALSALGVFKGVVSVVVPLEDEISQENEIEEKYVQVMHAIQEEYGEHLFYHDAALADLTSDGEEKWNRAFAKTYLSVERSWGTDTPDAGLDYALEMMPSHMIRGGLFAEAADLLSNSTFVRGRLFALGRENGTRRHIKDCELLFDSIVEQGFSKRKKLDPKATMRQSYQILGGLLNMDEDDYIAEEGSPEALEVARSHTEIGFSLAEKRCWEAAIAHWESGQELLVSSLGMVEVVAGIQLNVGVVHSEMNEYEQALGSLKQCLRIRGAIHGEEHILYAQTIQKIGDVFLAMSDYHEAMESYNWALDVMHIEPRHHRIDVGDILESMGNIHYSKGEIEEALQCFQDALRSKQVDLGEDHPELSTTYHHIGNCLSDQGKTEEAVAHFEEAIRLKLMDPDGGGERDADVLTIEGVLHNLNGEQQQGLECYEKALQILVTKVPHKKEKVASLLHLIGCVYLMSGEHKKAMKLFEESLQARRKVLGFVHLDVASTLFNMAFLHQTRNRLDKALKCLEEALKIRQLRLPDSEKVAVTHEKIGTLARSIGKTKKAEIAFGEALRIRKLIHGDGHEAVATVLQELGDLMDDLGEYDDAMKYYVEALDIRQTQLGPDDLAVAETLYSMGYSLQNNDNSERALQCFEESLSIRQFNLGEDAKEVGDTLNMMGFLMAQTGELEEALSLLWDALRIRKLREDHVKVSETLKNIGNVHREKQEYELAIECYEECLRIRRAELGDDHEKVADALIAMGNVQGDMEANDDAMRSYEEALRIRTMLYGEQDESVAVVLQYMGTLEFRAERLDRALQLLNEFIRIREEVGAENDGDFVNVLFMVGNIHKMQNNEEEAKRCWTEAYKIFQDLGLAEGNPQIAEVMSSLVDDPALKENEEAQRESAAQENMRDQQANAAVNVNVNVRAMIGRIRSKVKETANAATKRGKDRGQQL